ncbi:MAG: hypothetical protein OJF52_002842 [Nitrospira sp.]|nr:MAG: hypothetical protein OJF52_002842 [Nitrospira sp.]
MVLRMEGPHLRHAAEQILTKWREAEVALSNGQPVAQARLTSIQRIPALPSILKT